MNDYFDPQYRQRIAEARESFSGRLLTDTQFNEAIAITGIIEAEIYKSGTFKEKLADYAYAFARTEKFDVIKAETTLRDLFKANSGQTMNQLRETLMDREDQIDDGGDERAKDATRNIHAMIKDGDKMPFHRAYDTQAGAMASELGITIQGPSASCAMSSARKPKASSMTGARSWRTNITVRRSRPKKPGARKPRTAMSKSPPVSPRVADPARPRPTRPSPAQPNPAPPNAPVRVNRLKGKARSDDEDGKISSEFRNT